METKNLKNQSDRRNFLTNCITAGSVACFGCAALTVTAKNSQIPSLLPETGMSNEDVIRFALGYSVPIFKKMQNEIGKEKFLEMLERISASNTAEFITSVSKEYPEKTMKALGEMANKFLNSPPYTDMYKYEFVENSDKVLEVKYTGCIMAKLYKEMNAADIGYALECHPSEALGKAFNPATKHTSRKNMMKGDDYCIERFELPT